jgi:hypothetical protein
MKTNYQDKNGKDIVLGDKVNIHANPHHGVYEVKFGEYQLKPFSNKQIEVPHLGFYLSNGKDIVSLMHVLKQPTGSFTFTHSIEVVESKGETQEINMANLVMELIKSGVRVFSEHSIQTGKPEFVVEGFYKSGTAVLIEVDGKIIAHSRYDKKTEINSLYDLAVLNYDWWKSSKDRFEGWANPDTMWIPILEKFNLITKKIETLTTWE